MNQPSDQHSAKNSPEKLPHKISEFITRNFRGEFLTEIKTFRDKNGKEIYDIQLSQDNTLHHLRFNSLGTLIERNAEPLIELYDEDEIDEIE